MNLQYEDRTFTFPYANLFRDHTAEESADLEESVKEHGIEHPIHINKRDEVIDGRHRLLLAAKLCLPLSSVPLKVVNKDRAAEERMAVQLNEARRNDDRRQITLNRLERATRIQNLAKAGMTLRDIAEVEDISISQAHRDTHVDLEAARAELDSKLNHTQEDSEPTAPAPPIPGAEPLPYEKPEMYLPSAETKEQLCFRLLLERPQVSDYDLASTIDTTPEYVAKCRKKLLLTRPTDSAGLRVPLHLTQAYIDLLDEIGKVKRLLRDMRAKVRTLALVDMCCLWRAELNYLRDGTSDKHEDPRLESFWSMLRQGLPHATICPYCQWQGQDRPMSSCSACQGRGWVTKAQWLQAPENQRRGVKARHHVWMDGPER